MNTHTPHCTYNATPNTTTHSTAPAVPTCPPCNRQSTAMANIAQGYNPRTTATPATPTTSVSIPLDVYHTDILDEIETIKVTLHNLAGAFSALYYGKLSEWQIKGITGNALYSATDLHYLAECLLDKASEYLPNHLQGASHG